MEIFNDKTWKLSRITTEKGKEQFYQGLWSNEAEEKASRELLKITENFTLNFNCADVNGEVTGTVSAPCRQSKHQRRHPENSRKGTHHKHQWERLRQ